MMFVANPDLHEMLYCEVKNKQQTFDDFLL